ncbi:hypothetical protein [Nocardia sp. NPDC051463]|uniref:hypothetical protein n=1 Tax=Nocardia sp. NPDC051463 TaxID=3154845 RepID=UPI00344D72BE
MRARTWGWSWMNPITSSTPSCWVAGTYEPSLAIGVTSPYAHMRQYVVSSTLGRIDDPKVELVESDPIGLVRTLKQADGIDIWLAGEFRPALFTPTRGQRQWNAGHVVEPGLIGRQRHGRQAGRDVRS